MVIWHTIESGCPMCGNRVRLREVGGGFALGQDSDLLVRMKDKHVLQALIHTCLRCRFSGYDEDFQISIAPDVAERFRKFVTPQLGAPGAEPRATPLPDVQYYWAFRAAEALGKSHGELGRLLLRAYWCLRLAPSLDLSEEEHEARRRLYLPAAIAQLSQDAAREGDAIHHYLLGELSRRNGQFSAAIDFFHQALEYGSDEDDPPDSRQRQLPRYLRLAAHKLLRAAEECDSRDRTMEEIIYADSPD